MFFKGLQKQVAVLAESFKSCFSWERWQINFSHLASVLHPCYKHQLQSIDAYELQGFAKAAVEIINQEISMPPQNENWESVYAAVKCIKVANQLAIEDACKVVHVYWNNYFRGIMFKRQVHISGLLNHLSITELFFVSVKYVILEPV